MRRSTSFFVGVLGACLYISASPAHAQQLGHIIDDPAAELSTRDISAEDRARDTMNRYGLCVVRMKAVAVKKAISQSTDEAVDSALGRVAIDDCLVSGQLQMSPSLFRGAVFRALYIRDFGKVLRVAEVPAKAADVASAPAVMYTNPLQQFGDCVVRVAPVETRAFVLAEPATPVERAAIASLLPSLNGCVAPKEQIKFSRAVLQGVLAEALYKRSAASEPLRVK